MVCICSELCVVGLGMWLRVVTMATEGRGVTTEVGMLGVAAFSTRGRDLLGMTGVPVTVVCGQREETGQSQS